MILAYISGTAAWLLLMWFAMGYIIHQLQRINKDLNWMEEHTCKQCAGYLHDNEEHTCYFDS